MDIFMKEIHQFGINTKNIVIQKKKKIKLKR